MIARAAWLLALAAWLVALVACHGAAAPATTAAKPPPLAGLWGQELEIMPSPAGPLRLVREGDRWTAELAGARVVLAREGDDMVARFGRGELRVRVDHDVPRARWDQPAGELLGPYAISIALAPSSGTSWTGAVAPLPERLRLYLQIGAEGTAFVRETEVNVGRRLGVMHVEQAADELVFRDAHGQVAIRAQRTGDHLHATITGVPVALDLTRRDRDHAPGFYPRPAGDRGELAPPRQLADGWTVGTPDEVGLDRVTLERVVHGLVEAVPTSPTSPAIHSLVIARHGKLVVDEYFAGYSPDDLHDLRSAGKTFSTTLVGIAIDHHELATSDRVLDILGPPSGVVDARRAAITVEHLLDMSTGLACDDNDDHSPGNEDTMQDQTAQPDWYRYTWDLAMVASPGAHAAYCSATINLLGDVLVHRGHSALDDDLFAQLASPLDIPRAAINLMPTGQAYLGGGLRLRPRDFAKLAELVLEHGRWRGRQVVSAEWLARATEAHASINEPGDYGYGWWRPQLRVGERAIQLFNAGGNGGQLAFAVPSLDLVIAIDAGNYGNYSTWRKFRDELVPQLLVAVR